MASAPAVVAEPPPPVLALMEETPEEGRSSAQKRGMLLDDVPQSIKKSKVGATQFAHWVAYLVQGYQQDSGVKSGEFEGVGSWIGYEVVGVRVHSCPRRRTFEHKKCDSARRLTMMSISDGDAVVVVDEGPGEAQRSRKMPGNATGLTLFYEDRPQYAARTQVRYVDTPAGLVEVALTQAETKDGQDICEIWGGYGVGRAPVDEDDLSHAFKTYFYEEHQEYLQFGPGAPSWSSRGWRYPVGVCGVNRELVMSEVPADYPGLIGSEEVTLLGTCSWTFGPGRLPQMCGSCRKRKRARWPASCSSRRP